MSDVLEVPSWALSLVVPAPGKTVMSRTLIQFAPCSSEHVHVLAAAAAAQVEQILSRAGFAVRILATRVQASPFGISVTYETTARPRPRVDMAWKRIHVPCRKTAFHQGPRKKKETAA